MQKVLGQYSNAICDAPMLPGLLAQIPTQEPIETVCADGAYDTRSCLDAIAQGQEMALIPPRKNASYWKKLRPGSAYRNESILACKRLGERVMARTFGRKVVELHVRVAMLNRFSQIGRPQTVPVAAVA